MAKDFTPNVVRSFYGVECFVDGEWKGYPYAGNLMECKSKVDFLRSHVHGREKYRIVEVTCKVVSEE